MIKTPLDHGADITIDDMQSFIVKYAGKEGNFEVITSMVRAGFDRKSYDYDGICATNYVFALRRDVDLIKDLMDLKIRHCIENDLPTSLVAALSRQSVSDRKWIVNHQEEFGEYYMNIFQQTYSRIFYPTPERVWTNREFFDKILESEMTRDLDSPYMQSLPIHEYGEHYA